MSGRRRGTAEAGALFPVAPKAAVPGAEGHRARMRRKLLDAGPDALLDHELLEMVLFLALPRRDTKPVARALLARFGGFAEVLDAPPAQLAAVEGLGEAGIAALRLVQGAALRLRRATPRGMPLLDNRERLEAYLTGVLAREPVEQFRMLFLDSKHRLIADEVEARGGVHDTPADPREVVKRALELHATALILVHSRPSGDPMPSRAAIAMTAELRRAAEARGLALHDHLIVGKGSVLSFRRAGLF